MASMAGVASGRQRVWSRSFIHSIHPPIRIAYNVTSRILVDHDESRGPSARRKACFGANVQDRTPTG